MVFEQGLITLSSATDKTDRDRDRQKQSVSLCMSVKPLTSLNHMPPFASPFPRPLTSPHPPSSNVPLPPPPPCFGGRDAPDRPCQTVIIITPCTGAMRSNVGHCPASESEVCWLLNVPATCECISGTDLLRQFYVLPHSDTSCTSNFLPHPVTLC